MKILQINCVYPKGSTGKIVKCLHDAYQAEGLSSIVCYGRGKKVREIGVYKTSSDLEAKVHSMQFRLFGIEFAYSPIATKNLIRIIEKEQPDIVHLHCLNGNFVNVYRLINYLKTNHIKTILTLHAEIMHTAGCQHACECDKWKKECNNCKSVSGKISHFFRDDAKLSFQKMQRAIAGFSELTVVGVSEWLTERAKQSPIFCDCRFTTIKNGVDVNVFFHRETDELQKKLDIGKKVVLHVTPNFYSSIKGGEFVLAMAKRMPDVQFLIIGYNGTGTDLPSNVKAIAHTANQDELAEYYSMANVTLLTSKRETFSMVCAESLCCGTPIAGFKAGGPETIALPEYSDFVDQGDLDGLQKCLQKWLDNSILDKKLISKRAREEYSAKTMAAEYIKVYKD